MNKSIDELGRLVLPKSIRAALNITTETIINIQLKNKCIILTPISGTIYCGSCKTQLKENYKYCYECGVLISDIRDNSNYNS